jgi:hypothetical protein
MRSRLFKAALLCLFVYLFFVQAKLSVYRSAQPEIRPLTISKIWDRTQRVVTPVLETDSFLIRGLALLSALFLPLLMVVSRTRFLIAPAQLPHSDFTNPLFQRPPPAV